MGSPHLAGLSLLAKVIFQKPVLEEEESDYNVVIFEYTLDIIDHEKQCFNKRTLLFVHTNTNG